MPTVDLSNKGLSNGDTIDGYLQEYVNSGNTVLIPAGTYDFDGDGFGSMSDVAVMGDGGIANLDLGDGWYEFIDLHAESGTVTLENIAFRGANDANSASDRANVSVFADSGASVQLNRVHMPDGSMSGTYGQGYYVPDEHDGFAGLHQCHVEDMGNNGLYTTGANLGTVEVTECFFRNNNIAGIRLDSDGAVCRDTVVVVDGKSPYPQNQRGIWVREPGDGILFENCHVYYPHTGSGASFPFGLQSRDPGGSGEIRDCKIYNATNEPAIEHDTGSWTAFNTQVTGPGNDDIECGESGTCVGSNCEQPVTSKPWASDSITDGNDGADMVLNNTLYIEGSYDAQNITSYRITISGGPDTTAQAQKTAIRDATINSQTNDSITTQGDQVIIDGWAANEPDAYSYNGYVTDATFSASYALEVNDSAITDLQTFLDNQQALANPDTGNGDGDGNNGGSDDSSDDTSDLVDQLRITAAGSILAYAAYKSIDDE